MSDTCAERAAVRAAARAAGGTVEAKVGVVRVAGGKAEVVMAVEVMEEVEQAAAVRAVAATAAAREVAARAAARAAVGLVAG